jgi:hypothetical protein
LQRGCSIPSPAGSGDGYNDRSSENGPERPAAINGRKQHRALKDWDNLSWPFLDPPRRRLQAQERFTFGVHERTEQTNGRCALDLNYLFLRQQVERTKAEASISKAAREAHKELAKRYEKQIEELTGKDFEFPSEV